MWPTLLHLPVVDLDLPTYGVLVTLGIVAGTALTAILAARDGADPVRVFRLTLLVAVVALAGCRLMAIVNWPASRVEISIASVFGGGVVFYGGLIGGLVAGPFAARAAGLTFWQFADAAVPGLALGQAIGRVGCFAAGCCWGTPCDAPWGVVFPAGTVAREGMPWGAALHPVELYEAALALAICVALVALHGRRRCAGEVAIAYLVVYPVARFTLEFWRGDSRGELFGLVHASGFSPAQLTSFAVFALALVGYALTADDRRSDSRSSAVSASSAVRPT
jgi:phosphatidylglycerol:prolipoprotein diacylglycerol transferase